MTCPGDETIQGQTECSKARDGLFKIVRRLCNQIELVGFLVGFFLFSPHMRSMISTNPLSSISIYHRSDTYHQ